MTRFENEDRGWDGHSSNEMKPAIKKVDNYDNLQPYICGSELRKRRKTMKTTLMNIQDGMSVLGGILGWFFRRDGRVTVCFGDICSIGLYYWHVKRDR